MVFSAGLIVFSSGFMGEIWLFRRGSSELMGAGLDDMAGCLLCRRYSPS